MDQQTELQQGKTWRMEWVDIARGIGMLLIIEGHLGYPSWMTDLAFSVHVPLFFLISGYLAKPGKPGALKKYARRLLVPYLLTGLSISVIESVKVYSSGDFYQSVSILLQWLEATAFGSGTNPSPILGIPMIGATWFLLSLFFALSFYETVYQSRNAWVIVLGVFAVGFATSGLWWLPWSIQPACTALLFIHIGHVAREKGFDPSRLEVVPFLVAAAIWIAVILVDHGEMYIVTNHFKCLPLDVLGAVAGTIVICRVSALFERVPICVHSIGFLGRHSLPAMCFHLLELTCVPWWDIVVSFGLGWRRLTVLLVFSAKIAWTFFWAYVCAHMPLPRNFFGSARLPHKEGR